MAGRMEEMRRNSSSPELVANIVLEAVTSKNPNLRYLAGKDVKDISISTTTLDGEPAYRIEDTMWILDRWDKDISIYSIKNGNVYQISALAKPEEIEKYSEAIENMFKSVKFH